MRLIFFQEKLKQEIKELEEFIQGDCILSQRIQPTIYCIAALLRKILERLPKLGKAIEKVNVIEMPDWNSPLPRVIGRSINLPDLLDVIIHYIEFLPSSYSSAVSPLRTRHITVLSDTDCGLRRREFAIADFIAVAKQIAEDDALIISCLVPRAKKLLGEIVHSSSDKKFIEIKTREILIDFFDVAWKIKEGNWPEGKITIFREERKGLELMGVQTEETEYKVLLQKMNNEWWFGPFRQFEPYQKQTNVLEFQCKMIDLQSFSSEHFEHFMIRAKDLLDVLDASNIN